MSSREPQNPASVSSTHCLDDASYVIGSLSPAERQAFELHLATCPRCQASISQLAGLPGLLALTSAIELEREPLPVPDTLLPRLLTAAACERKRRRVIWTGTVAAAAACVVALVITLIVRPSTPTTAVALPPPIEMQQVVKGPMNASMQLVDKQWGTSIVVNCEYRGEHGAGEKYQVVVYDASGKPHLVGDWKSVAGGGTTVWASSSLNLDQIARVEVQWPNGKTVLSAVPRHS
ncbi:hypothetical protein ABIB25_001758 [Nakamurella sp. UYEF19]|uniref:anti-sigma factor family protein n=1 Tax=Nakamurella sp. UYEF19 TaxID=1756392 RepID=UPI003392692D